VLIERTVAQAAADYDPEDHGQRERAGADAWDVALVHRSDGGWAGTSHLDATGDTVDLTKFYDLVCDHAAHLARLGDPDPLGARKAKALGIIADAQTHLDLHGPTPDPSAAEDTSEPAIPVRRPTLAKTRLYLHLRLTDLLDPLVRVGAVEGLGPATTAKIRQWLAGSRATIVPVLDLGRDDAADQHDPPPRIRESVVLRDQHCVFPWCMRDARSCDLDHITAYLAPDNGGPPGQTAASNLAPLCRRHHNAKTTGRWRYLRHPDGTYTWHSPHGAGYHVTCHGTTPLSHP
jgi:hypothetical protein